MVLNLVSMSWQVLQHITPTTIIRKMLLQIYHTALFHHSPSLEHRLAKSLGKVYCIKNNLDVLSCNQNMTWKWNFQIENRASFIFLGVYPVICYLCKWKKKELWKVLLARQTYFLIPIKPAWVGSMILVTYYVSFVRPTTSFLDFLRHRRSPPSHNILDNWSHKTTSTES